jgi:hypothetical protein
MLCNRKAIRIDKLPEKYKENFDVSSQGGKALLGS